MLEKQFREANGNWKGGRHISSHGYVKVLVGVDHPLADSKGYAYEHKLIAEVKLGRPLEKGEQVHHLDGDKTNNAQENIAVVQSIAHHRAFHRKRNNLRKPDENNPIVSCLCGCGSMFRRYDATGRPRKWIPGHNTIDLYRSRHA